jgi:hypothetical protein
MNRSAQLTAALGIAWSLSGCGGAFGLLVEDCPKVLHQVEILKPPPGGLPKDGKVDAATCRSSCAHPGLDYEQISCFPAGVEFQRLPGRLVHCELEGSPSELWRPITDAALAAAEAERDAIQKRDRGDDAESLARSAELYQRLCGATPGAFNPNYDRWSVEPPMPPPPPPGERFVVCDVVIRRGCPGPF